MIKFEGTPPGPAQSPAQEQNPALSRYQREHQQGSTETNRLEFGDASFDQPRTSVPEAEAVEGQDTPLAEVPTLERPTTEEKGVMGTPEGDTENINNNQGLTPETRADESQMSKAEKQESAEAALEVATAEAEAKIPVSPESLHNEIESLMRLEPGDIENPNKIIDPQEQLRALDNSFAEIDGRLAELQTELKEKKTAMERLRNFLGMESTTEPSREEQEIEALNKRKLELTKYKEEAEEMAELQEVMDELHKLPAVEIAYIIANGTMTNGEPVKTKAGKEVKADIAKEIAGAVQNGVKFLTRLVVKTVLAVAKGVIGGIFEAVKQIKNGLA